MPTADAKFTVIVCTYNYAHLLPDALRTLAAQTSSDFELLVADDGSTDNTKEVVNQFRPNFQDLHYFKKSHTGLADTRNAAIQAAQGSHIAFLDADDLWSPHYLQTIREVFTAHPEAGLVLCEGITFRSDGRILTEAVLENGLPLACGPVHSAENILSILRGFSPSGMVFAKAVYSQIGPFDTQFHEGLGDDIDWTLRALLSKVFCVCLKQQLYLYRRHSANLTNKAAGTLRAWFRIYSETLGEPGADPQVKALVRAQIRFYAVRLLPECPRAERTLLAQNAILLLDQDAVLKLYSALMPWGLIGLLKSYKGARRFARRLLWKRLAIDLDASPEAIFDALPK